MCFHCGNGKRWSNNFIDFKGDKTTKRHCCDNIEEKNRLRGNVFQTGKHSCSVVTSWKNNHFLESLEWPAQSPDLNPIHNLWIVLKKAISKRCPTPKKLSDLQAIIREEWGKIPVEIVQILIESRRLKQVIKSQGFATKFRKEPQYFFCMICVNEL